jgi:hypothetical protein
MTEEEWLACADRRELLRGLPEKPTPRKLRLFACACCRRIWDRLTDERSRNAVEVAEQYADGPVDHKALKSAWNAASLAERLAGWGSPLRAATEASHPASSVVASAANAAAWAVDGQRVWSDPRTREGLAQADLVRDLLGNPFRRVPFLAAWRTPDVAELAAAICAGHDFSADSFAALADALEEAGCNEPAILDHLRGPGPHARGCWVLDQVLGQG